MIKQFTATAYVVDQGKVLLVKHRKFGKWLPPGGHIEINEIPTEAAKREVLEETGYEIEFVKEEHCWIEAWNGRSIERPYMCVVFEVPEHGNEPAHQHIDLIYVAHLVPGKKRQEVREIEESRWFTFEEILAMKGDVEIFAETQKVIQCILK